MAADGMELAVAHPRPLAPSNAPEDPLQRLDETMAQTDVWASLRTILADSAPFVRDTICNALNVEFGRSFQNVVGQLQALAEVRGDLLEVLDSEDAAALNHLMRDIHPSNLNALQREADGINKDITALRASLESGDLEGLQRQAKRMANKAKRFRDKYAELRPKLEKLQTELTDLAAKCAAGVEESDRLIKKTEERREWWWMLLSVVNGLVFFGGLCACGWTLALAVPAFAAVCGKSLALTTAKAALSKAMSVAATKAAAAEMAKASAAKAAATAASAGSGGGNAAAAVAGVASAATASAAGVGAPAATFLGSEALGSLAVSAGLMATPAAPVGVALGVGAVVAGAVKLLSSVAAGHAADQAASAAATAAAVAHTAAQESAAAAAAVTAAGAEVASIQGAIASLWAQVTAATPFLCGGGLLIALALLGYAGRELVKKLLAKLWAAEIEKHNQTKEAFNQMEKVLKEAAKKLKTVSEKNNALESCLDLVIEAAETVAASAEDAQEGTPSEAEMATLHGQVEELCAVYQRVPEAFEELHSSLRDFAPAAEHVYHLAQGHEQPGEDQDQGLTLNLVEGPFPQSLTDVMLRDDVPVHDLVVAVLGSLWLSAREMGQQRIHVHCIVHSILMHFWWTLFPAFDFFALQFPWPDSSVSIGKWNLRINSLTWFRPTPRFVPLQMPCFVPLLMPRFVLLWLYKYK